MTKEEIDAHIKVLRKSIVKSDASGAQLEVFEASMALVRDALICLNVLAKRGQ